MKNKGSSILEEKKDQAKKLKVIAAPLVEYIRINEYGFRLVLLKRHGRNALLKVRLENH